MNTMFAHMQVFSRKVHTCCLADKTGSPGPRYADSPRQRLASSLQRTHLRPLLGLIGPLLKRVQLRRARLKLQLSYLQALLQLHHLQLKRQQLLHTARQQRPAASASADSSVGARHLEARHRGLCRRCDVDWVCNELHGHSGSHQLKSNGSASAWDSEGIIAR